MIPRLHLVTDDVVLQQSSFITIATELLLILQRRLALHIRGHSLPAKKRFELITELRPRAQTVGSTLVINDRVDIALAAEVRAVQLGVRYLPVATVRSLAPHFLIGYSAHSAAECSAAERDGADFLFAGSIYPSASHPGMALAGLPLLESCVAGCRIPVLAIGGVTPERVPEIMRTGAYGAAVIRAVWQASDPVLAAEQLAKLLYDDN